MKVLFLIDSLQGSGAERSLVDIAINFTQIEPIFVHIYEGSMLKEDLENKGIKVYSLNLSRSSSYKDAVKVLVPIYLQEQPDVVHSTLYNADMIARKLKSQFPEIPLVGSFVNNSYTPLRYRNKSIVMKLKLWRAYLLDKVSSKKVDFFISNSQTIKQSEGNALSVPFDKIEVIYRGRNVERFENINCDKVEKLVQEYNLEGKNVLLNVSRLIERKAQFDIIKALPAILKDFPNTILIFAGHGNQEVYLRDLAKSLNVENNTIFLGRSTNVPELLHLSDLFVYASYAEGLPGALIEAMMSEKIIIASNIGENLECVDQESALIFEKGNVAELTEKILYALKNKEQLTVLGKEAKTQAIQKFDINIISRKYEDRYSKIVSNSKKHA
ncbi:glycosyltransferase family 4 protein [Salinimicrobium sp. TIG7-5_MAKvit]|uniref:glycosyltransferase family 4 protein n=1 Tax=Salinimicrobium sp. TIG7-5_MAKvit TaxID=3121289 RepID=UPI003C6E1853